MSSKLISVIIPVYNREKFLAEAINSVLEQTYKNFELLIIDDASTDNSLKIAKGFMDPRIKIYKNKSNKGVSFSRNRGIELASGEFLAFLDSDDICIPCRLEKQMKILESSRDINICGSWLQIPNNIKLIKLKEVHEEIMCEMLLHCSISVGTVLANCIVFKRYKFDTNLEYGEDYDLWSKLIWDEKMYNIQEPLVYYRYHANQLSVRHKEKQLRNDLDIRLNLFQKIQFNQKEYSDNFLYDLLVFNESMSTSSCIKALRWFKLINKLNKRQKVFPVKNFEKVIDKIKNVLVFKIFGTKTFSNLSKRDRVKIFFSLDTASFVYILKLKIKEKIKVVVN